MLNCDARFEKSGNIDTYFLRDNKIFPNNRLPVLHYKQAIKLPFLFSARKAKSLLVANNWTNNWKAGIYTFHHYHSNTHEAMIVIGGKTMILLGGENGTMLTIRKGDVIVIPAGVAHKNLGRENAVTCIGGYPKGIIYDMHYGVAGERPDADKRIKNVPLPPTGPICGSDDALVAIWSLHNSKIIQGDKVFANVKDKLW